MPDNYDDHTPVEVAPGVYHLGVKDEKNSWANIPYLIVEGDEAVIIDPGSAKPEFYSTVMRKVHAICDPRKIKYQVVQHQDPDLCAALPIFEKIIDPKAKVLTPVESLLLVQHYGLDCELQGVQDGESILLGGKRKISFFMTPYAHFIGTMVTYDHETRTLFTSDAFGGFTVGNNIEADDSYPEFLTTFLGQYLGSKRALEYALKRIEQLQDGPGVDRFCPQHGCVISKEQIPVYMAAAHGLKVGDEVDRLAKKNGIELNWTETEQLVTV
jgi:flavorubredoxin